MSGLSEGVHVRFSAPFSPRPLDSRNNQAFVPEVGVGVEVYAE